MTNPFQDEAAEVFELLSHLLASARRSNPIFLTMEKDRRRAKPLRGFDFRLELEAAGIKGCLTPARAVEMQSHLRPVGILEGLGDAIELRLLEPSFG